MAIDYQKELSSFVKQEKREDDREKVPWFSPPVGMHKVYIAQEGKEFETEYKGDVSLKHRFAIVVKDKAYNWGVTKAKKREDGTFRQLSKSSLWGQLVILGSAWGTLEDKNITLMVKETDRKDGKKIKNYTVIEAVELMSENGESEDGKED